MNAHKNARLVPHSQVVLMRRVVEDGQTLKSAAAAFGVCPKTAAKWVVRFRTEGIAGLRDRSSRPHKLRQPTPEYVIRRIETLRCQRWTGLRVATKLGISSTVSRTLRRFGLSRIKDIDPLLPPRRYERSRPGEMIHIDIKKLGRFKAPGHPITGWHTGMHRSGGAGWEYLHVCIDDCSRVAFSAVMPDQTVRSAIAFLQATVAYYQNLGITIECVMTDNGPCYTSRIFRISVPSSTSAISGPNPTPREPTARPSASYRPPSGNGLMRPPIRHSRNEATSFQPGFIYIIGTTSR